MLLIIAVIVYLEAKHFRAVLLYISQKKESEGRKAIHKIKIKGPQLNDPETV